MDDQEHISILAAVARKNTGERLAAEEQRDEAVAALKVAREQIAVLQNELLNCHQWFTFNSPQSLMCDSDKVTAAKRLQKVLLTLSNPTTA